MLAWLVTKVIGTEIPALRYTYCYGWSAIQASDLATYNTRFTSILARVTWDKRTIQIAVVRFDETNPFWR